MNEKKMDNIQPFGEQWQRNIHARFPNLSTYFLNLAIAQSLRVFTLSETETNLVQTEKKKITFLSN